MRALPTPPHTHRSDRFVRRLWETAQSLPAYRGRTALVLATDHGRGATPRDWTDHGEKVPAAGRVWMAVMGPGTPANGGVHLALSGSEWQGEGLDLRTTNGGLHVAIPEGYNARLETGTVNGGVESDLPLTTRGRHTGGRIETDLGRGGRLIRVETTNGGLHVQRR